jgi:hypothetical protein
MLSAEFSAMYGEVAAEEQLGLLSLEGAECSLDVGCGERKITADIASRVPRGSMLGVDPSQERATRSHALLDFTRGDGMASKRWLWQFAKKLDMVILRQPVHERLAGVEDAEAGIRTSTARRIRTRTSAFRLS